MTLTDKLEALVAGLGASTEDAVLIQRGCDRAVYAKAVEDVSRVWGRPITLNTDLAALLDLTAAGFGEAIVAAWRRGPILAYLCWRRGPETQPEFFCGAYEIELLPRLFLNPLTIGHNHAVRASEHHPLGGQVRLRPLSEERAG